MTIRSHCFPQIVRPARRKCRAQLAVQCVGSCQAVTLLLPQSTGVSITKQSSPFAASYDFIHWTMKMHFCCVIFCLPENCIIYEVRKQYVVNGIDMKLLCFLSLCIVFSILEKLENTERYYEMHPSVNDRNRCQSNVKVLQRTYRMWLDSSFPNVCFLIT
jgi:hypothetical protein